MSASNNILIVDDEEDLRMLLSLDLKRMGFHVTEAGTGAEGVISNRTTPADIIITDMYMPDMNGAMFLRAVKQDSASLPPVIVVTGDAAEIEPLQEELNIVAILMKPFFPDEIRTAISKALNHANRKTS